MTKHLHALVGVLVALLVAVGVSIGVHALVGPAPNPAAKVTAVPPSSVKAPAPAVKQPAACPGKHDFMGCSASRAAVSGPPRLLASPRPAGEIFPDVSSWQGHPNWAAAKGSIAGAAYKLGEYTVDPDAVYNAGELKRLGIPNVAYWFVRPTGCAHEGALIESSARELHVHKLVLDEETSGISGYAACLDPYVVRATGQHADVYRSSGNDFDSSNPKGVTLACWVAAYGPSSTPSCGGRKVSAFQFTDGRFGFPVYIPGIGQGDVSVDYSLLKATAPSNPCPANVKVMSRRCLPYFPDVKFGSRTGIMANERTVVTEYKNGWRTDLVHAQLVFLRDRVTFVSTHHRVHGKWVKDTTNTYGLSHRGYRRTRLARDAAGL